eukprot:s1349_g20.t1
MRKLNRKMQQIFEELEVPAADRMHRVAHTDLKKKSDEYPCLKHQKGARIRKFLPVACKLAEQASDTDHGQVRFEMMKSLQEMNECIEEEEVYRWSGTTRQKFEDACNKTLKHYVWLAKEAFQKEEFKWTIVQKHHVNLYLPSQAKWLSPRRLLDLCKLASACLHGTAAWKAGWRLDPDEDRQVLIEPGEDVAPEEENVTPDPASERVAGQDEDTMAEEEEHVDYNRKLEKKKQQCGRGWGTWDGKPQRVGKPKGKVGKPKEPKCNAL